MWEKAGAFFDRWIMCREFRKIYFLYLAENEVVTKCEGDGNTYLPSPFVALFKVSCTRLDLERLLSGSACLRFTGWSNHFC